MKNTDVDSHWCLAPKRLLSYQSVVHLPRETVRAGGIQQQSPPLHFKQASEKVAANFEQLQPYNEKWTKHIFGPVILGSRGKWAWHIVEVCWLILHLVPRVMYYIKAAKYKSLNLTMKSWIMSSGSWTVLPGAQLCAETMLPFCQLPLLPLPFLNTSFTLKADNKPIFCSENILPELL